MPCYTEWDAYLDKDGQEYRTKKAELEAKLKAVKHIVSYYYGVERLRVPPAQHSGKQSSLEIAHLQFKVNDSNLCQEKEILILKRISHHCSCDGIHFLQIYDFVSLLDISDSNEAGYARVLMACANEIRANTGKYSPISDQTDLDLGTYQKPDPNRIP